MNADNSAVRSWYDPEKSYEENYENGPGASLREAATDKKGGLPFGIPAGPLLNGAYVIAALNAGYDIPVYKTVRTREYKCHPWPNVLPVNLTGDLKVEEETKTLTTKEGYTDPLSITNSFGVPSKSPDIWQPDMERAAKSASEGQMVVGSFQGTKWEGASVDEYVGDWVLGAKLVKETGVAEVEANLSCPNEGKAHLLCYDIPRAVEIVDKIKNEIGDTPLIVKIGYFADEPLREFVKSVGPLVQGISAINTIPAKVVTGAGEQALPGEGRLVSGICGDSIRWAGIQMVKRMADLRTEINLSF
ncbi:hypothetical protein K2X83_02750, partial [Patescibacteria group bacterium]|nr:hypothetical protein [Patescibacteria group bacterium]